MSFSKITMAFLIGFTFLLIGISVLPDYGINWDEPAHFMRGQAYLHYFLTGKKDYRDLSEFKNYYQKEGTIFFFPVNIEKEKIPRRSLYQNENYTASEWLTTFDDFAHPPLSGIFASFFNYIFFQKLGIINDIDSYHLYILFTASILVAVVFLWVSKIYGCFAAFISSLSLTVYPLFLGEAHFNVKDIPETVFYSLTIITFYEALIKRKSFWIILSGVFFGLAWATKFNILFAPVIILFWLLIYLIGNKEKLRTYFSLIPSFIAYPFIAISILIASWPVLWSSPIKNLLKSIGYYKGIGTSSSFNLHYLNFLSINTYAFRWILYTTPLVILLFASLSIIYALQSGFKEKNKTVILIILWLLVPIARVSIPMANIYGGVRQIMEYIPAMAILSGIGANYILEQIRLRDHLATKSLLLLKVLIVLMFLPITLKLISIHPNEGVYFNSLIGGLSGAKKRNIPYWGESLGNPNRQGVTWINKNAEKNAKLVTNFGLGSSIPSVSLRNDIQFSNTFRSVLERNEEYIIGLTHQTMFENTYFFNYLERFLIPLYEIKVDGVALLKIWKNDLSHTKDQYKEVVPLPDKPKFLLINKSLSIDLGKAVPLAKMAIQFNKENCDKNEEGRAKLSLDGKEWKTMDGELIAQDLLPKTTYQENNSFLYYFAADKARYIRVDFSSDNSCFKYINSLKIFIIKHLI